MAEPHNDASVLHKNIQSFTTGGDQYQGKDVVCNDEKEDVPSHSLHMYKYSVIKQKELYKYVL